jgi:O-antigen ligase
MNLRYALLVPVVLLLVVFAGKLSLIDPFIFVTGLLCILIALVTFHNPVNGLIIIVFSMLLSPEIRVADVPGRPLAIRMDDIMIIVMFISWLAYTGLNKNWQGFIKTPLDPYLLLLSAIYVLSTAIWVIFGTLNPLKGTFYILKYLEYFILYWIVVNSVTHLEDVNRLLIPGLITAVIVTIYAYSLMPSHERVYAPFNIGGGEPASLGGYYLVILAIVCSFLLHAEQTSQILISGALILFILPAFIKTLSRASYLALIPLLATIFLLTKKRKIIFGMVLLFGAVVFPLLFPSMYAEMINRVGATFTSGHSEQFSKYEIGSGSTKITDQSALERISSWRMVVKDKFSRNIVTMLIGCGVTGLGFVEGQFFLVLGETGIVGTLVFYLLMLKIIFIGYRTYRESSDVLSQSLSLGLVAGLIGILFQSLTTNSFIIVRIMEPFWVLTALVIMLPELKQKSQQQAIAVKEPFTVWH